MDLLNKRPSTAIRFDRVPSPLSPENRPVWRISIITLILYTLSRANKASSQKILAISSIISSKYKRSILDAVLSHKELSSKLSIRFDPAVNKAIDFGIAEGLFKLDRSKNIELTEKGLRFSKALLADDAVLLTEKRFVGKYSKNTLSEKAITELLSGEL